MHSLTSIAYHILAWFQRAQVFRTQGVRHTIELTGQRTHILSGLRPQLTGWSFVPEERPYNVKQNADRRLPPGGNARCRHTR